MGGGEKEFHTPLNNIVQEQVTRRKIDFKINKICVVVNIWMIDVFVVCHNTEGHTKTDTSKTTWNSLDKAI